VAIGQVGQAVVEGDVVQLALGQVARGDVVQLVDQAGAGVARVGCSAARPRDRGRGGRRSAARC
jgi:hypothetical protein